MAKVKTYWDEIKNEETHFYGGTQGWEVHLRWVEFRKWNRETGEYTRVKRLELQFPFGTGDGVKAAEKALVRKEVNFKKRKRKILAQASRNYEEYRDLNSRLSRISDEEFDEMIRSGMKGFPLGQYIRERHLTDGEAHSLFWRM